MQLYVDFYSQLHYSTCFGRRAPIIRSIKNCICDHWYTSHIIDIESWCTEPCV